MNTHFNKLYMKTFLNAIVLFLLVSLNLLSYSQNFVLPLYLGEIPNSKHSGQKEKVEITKIITIIRNVQEPDIAVYLPSKQIATRQAVVICPGGGYRWLAYDLEGTDVARYLNTIGVAGIVLKYRLPNAENWVDPHKVPLMDAQRAMRVIRYNAEKWNIDTEKIGIMGFSAGGHMASTLGTHFDYGNKDSKDSIERKSCRPDFMILMYPVISFVDTTCIRPSSGKTLLGENPDQSMKNYYSNELQVQNDTPPTFLVHADNDGTVKVEHTLLMYKALHKKKLPVELHILSEGYHGFGLGLPEGGHELGLGLENNHVASWTENLRLWLNWLNKK